MDRGIIVWRCLLNEQNADSRLRQKSLRTTSKLSQIFGVFAGGGKLLSEQLVFYSVVASIPSFLIGRIQISQ